MASDSAKNSKSHDHRVAFLLPSTSDILEGWVFVVQAALGIAGRLATSVASPTHMAVGSVPPPGYDK